MEGPLIHSPLRLPQALLDRAEVIAARRTTAVHEVTRSDILRHAIALGLDAMDREDTAPGAPPRKVGT